LITLAKIASLKHQESAITAFDAVVIQGATPMSQNSNKFELPTVTFENTQEATASNTARQALSSFAAEAGQAAGQAGKNGANAAEAAQLGSRAAEQAVEGVAGKVGKGIAVEGQLGEMQKVLEGSGKFETSIKWPPKREVTDADREAAKKLMSKSDLAGLVPPEDLKVATDLTDALIDGNVDKLKETLKGLSGDPEKLAKFVKAVNDHFNSKENFGGLEMQMDAKGNVLVYENKGSTAVSINPATGETTVRGIERQPDGSILMKEGEIINRTAADVLKSAGDAVTRSVTGMDHWGFIDKIRPTELPSLGGGGGGGGGRGDRLNNLPKPVWGDHKNTPLTDRINKVPQQRTEPRKSLDD